MNTEMPEGPRSRRDIFFDTEIMGGPDRPGHDII
jgi:hypothetical protein